MARRLLRLLLSRRTAIALMVAMVAILALSTLVPSADLSPVGLEELRRARPFASFLAERLRPEAVARSPLFVALAALVFASTAWSIAERVRLERSRRRIHALAGRERFRATRSFACRRDGEAITRAATSVARADRFRIEPSGAGGDVLATRGGLGFAGSITFHVGILVTMVAVAVSAWSRFNAEAVLVEGAPRPLVPGVVVNASPSDRMAELGGWTLGIRDFHAEYARGFQHVDFAVLLRADGPGGERREEVVRVNQPVEVGGFQLTLYRYGFATGLAVSERGRELANGLALLYVIPPGKEDGLALADGSELRLALYPDHVVSDGHSASRGMTLANPVLKVRHVSKGAEIASGTVALGTSTRIGGLDVNFAEVRYWADFQIARDLGVPWLAVGSALIALGLALRFLFDPQTLQVSTRKTPDGTRVDLVVSARYFPALNEQRADRLAAELEEALRGQGEVAA